MGIITKMRKQTAIYWASNGIDEYGQPEYALPVDIDCRWEDAHEEFIDGEGTRQVSQAIVYVDRDMEVGSVLKLGVIDSGTDESNPKNNDDAFEVRRFEKLPNLKNTEYLRTAIL